MKRVLVLCTGNSCRSQMAEVIFNYLGQGKWSAVSAGSKPTGHVHPLALETLALHQLCGDGLRSKSWEEFNNQKFAVVITVCDNAKESCPIFPGAPEKIHWSIPDPAKAAGTLEAQRLAFEQVFADLQDRIQLFLSTR